MASLCAARVRVGLRGSARRALRAPMAPVTPVRRWSRPAPVPTIAAFACVTLFVAAGLWQRDRMQQKLALGAKLEAAVREAPVPVPRASAWDAWRFRPVVASGTFDAARQILIDNKVHAGRAGYDVVTPLMLADGRAVLVDRGWIAAGPSRARLPDVPPPAGEVAVVGRINLPPARYLELDSGTATGPVWQNLDPARYAQAAGIAVLPIVIEQTAPIAPGDTLVRERPPPDLGVSMHRMYMMQWFAFAALTAGLWLYFTFRRKR